MDSLHSCASNLGSLHQLRNYPGAAPSLYRASRLCHDNATALLGPGV